MLVTDRKFKKLEQEHHKLFSKICTCLDELRSKGIYKRFYTEWYKRAAQATGAHEELIYSYNINKDGTIDKTAYLEDITDAVRNCSAYAIVAHKFYLDSPLEVYQNIEQAAIELKEVFATVKTYLN